MGQRHELATHSFQAAELHKEMEGCGTLPTDHCALQMGDSFLQGLRGLWHMGAGPGRALGEATCAGLQGYWRFSPRECVSRERSSKAQVLRCEKQTAKEQPARACVGTKTGAEAGREAGLGHLRPLFSGKDLRGTKPKPFL